MARVSALRACHFHRGAAPRRVRVATLLVACHLSAWGTSARGASPVNVAIDYEVPPANVDCPDIEEFRASVRRQLGYDPFRPDADRRVAVQIARKELGFGGRIRWSDADGRWVGDRRLSSPRSDCGGIAASLAFSVAVQIQLMAALAPAAAPEAVAVPLEPPAPAPVASLPVVPATTVEQPRRERSPPSSEAIRSPAALATSTPPRRLKLSVGLGPSIALGVAPETTGLGRLFVRGRVGRLSLELAGDAALPITRREAGTAGFSVDRFAAMVAACGHAAIFAACVTGTLGRLQANGFGVDVRASPVAYLSQVGLRAMATHTVGGRFFAAARVDGLVMISPSTVTLNETPVWTTPRVGALFGMDLGANFF